MVSEEVKETIYIAIGAIVAALILGLLAFTLQLRRDYVETYNTAIQTQLTTERYAKYSGYNDTIIYGDELIALLSEFWGEDITIYIDEIFFGKPSTSSPYGPSGLRYTGKVGHDTVAGADGILLNKVRMDNITKGRKSKASDCCYYDLEDLQVGRTFASNGGNRVDPNSAYYVFVATGDYAADEYKNISFNSGFSYSSGVTTIVIRHIRYTDNPTVFTNLSNINPKAYNIREGKIAVESLVRQNTTLMQYLQKN